ncbi:hypothetical protein TRIATDRAFT_297034 [Trichoderma atroviride IMI 206040]|uniref:Uncharacterized protein n=1 Tax=Hypocrea atroviridis (strain ATCC 20476 / IMI 206040) TaxID=452589 RepID=G9NFE8_HYPAI|nr:uncharacterized protein TRIATDRAFT_297034 [Trichoderma atroviride IMI 206040]EHK50663.1 hypothetical protein TRIATDRAFT_297034 [Trichoderma atroviride IMI 206040]
MLRPLFSPLLHLVWLRDDETNTYECHGSFFWETCTIAIVVKGHLDIGCCSNTCKYE